MELSYLVRGLVIGFSIAAPVGPIGVLCIRRTLAQGRVAGFVSGMGAATADAFYGTIAAFGLTFISTFLVSQQAALRLVGGLFLCYLGIRTFLARPATEESQRQHARRVDELGRRPHGVDGHRPATRMAGLPLPGDGPQRLGDQVPAVLENGVRLHARPLTSESVAVWGSQNS